MNAKLNSIVFKWVQYAGIIVSEEYIDDQLQSSSGYLSLASIIGITKSAKRTHNQAVYHWSAA